MATRLEHAGDLGQQLARVFDVLQDLLAVDELEARGVERERATVEGHEVGVAAGAARHLRRVLDVHADPAHVRIHRAEEVHGVARAAAEVHHAARPQPRRVVVREHRPAVVGRDAVAEQLSEVVAEHGGVGSHLVRLALALCVLLMAAPAVALADYPVISYVDENGVFRLYEAEFARDVDPPPPVPANFLGFRYGISLNGRYIVFNDAAKQLHLLDRATNTQVPLPAINVYANPGSLSVSNTGRIAFDDDGVGPSVVYDSAAGQFLDTGLTSGHLQPRLSGDGLFLATTCSLLCVDALGLGGDPYLQDLASKSNTGFVKDGLVAEERPCIDADGSLVGLDKPPGSMLPRDVYVFDRSVSPAQAISLPGLNDAAKDETGCVLDATGAYVGLTYAGTPGIPRVPGRQPGVPDASGGQGVRQPLALQRGVHGAAAGRRDAGPAAVGRPRQAGCERPADDAPALPRAAQGDGVQVRAVGARGRANRRPAPRALHGPDPPPWPCGGVEQDRLGRAVAGPEAAPRVVCGGADRNRSCRKSLDSAARELPRAAAGRRQPPLIETGGNAGSDSEAHPRKVAAGALGGAE